MSDSSGFSNLLGSARLPAQGINAPSGQEKTIATLIGLPNGLREIKEPARLRSRVTEVVREPRSNETRIKVQTNRGAVELRIPADRPPPREGQSIEIEIQPNPNSGRPPETAQIQNAPPEQSQPQPRPDQPQNTAPPPRPLTTPVNVTLGEAQTAEPQPQAQPIVPPQDGPPPLPPTLPPADTIIRLLPIPARDLPALLAQQPVPVIISASAAPQSIAAPLAETLLAQPQPQAQTTTTTLNIETLITRPIPALPTLQPTLQATFNIAPTSAPIPAPIGPEAIAQLTANIVLAPPQTTSSISATLTPILSPGISITPTINAEALPASAPLTLTLNAPTPLSQTSTSQALNNAPLDARITQVAPPLVQIAPPGTDKINETLQNISKNSLPSVLTKNTITSQQTPASLNGFIIGTAPQSLPIISLFSPDLSSVQSFILQTPTQFIAPGTQIQVAPQATATPQISALPNPLTGVAFPLLPEPWPLLNELSQQLAQVSAATAQAFNNIIPNTANPAQITPAALFFITALRGGDLSALLGDKTTQALRASGKGSILTRLTQESGLLSRLASDPVSQDWRALPLPIMHDNEIHKIMIHYKQDDQGSDDDGQSKGKTTRFIFDLALDRMGKVQIDGLFRAPSEDNTRLDLVIRTEGFLSQAMQMNMRQIYASGLKQTTITGELTFQNQADQWVTIQADHEQTLGMDA